QDLVVPALVCELAQLCQERRFVRERVYHAAPLRSLPGDRMVGEVRNLDVELLVRLIVRRPEAAPQRVRRPALPDVELALDPRIGRVNLAIPAVPVIVVVVLQRQLGGATGAELEPGLLVVEQKLGGIDSCDDDQDGGPRLEAGTNGTA